MEKEIIKDILYNIDYINIISKIKNELIIEPKEELILKLSKIYDQLKYNYIKENNNVIIDIINNYINLYIYYIIEEIKEKKNRNRYRYINKK